MLKYFCSFFVLASLLMSACNSAPASSLDEEAKAHARSIISKMSLSEKTAQLQVGSFQLVKKAIKEDGELDFDSLAKYFPYGFGASNLDRNLIPEQYVKALNAIQAYHQTLKTPIPVVFLGEGLHGLMSQGATVFPQANALGCSWDTVLVQKVYEVTAAESHARGIRQLLTPVLDLARDPRFGRIEEMYSEDPFLVGKMGVAAVRGFQQPDSAGNLFVAATLKHFVGHGQPEGGRNVSLVNVSANDIMNNHLLPFEMALYQGNAAAVMPAYNEVCDVPVHANSWLMNDVLRRQMGFKGLVISDQNAVDELHRTHAVVEDEAGAAFTAIKMGIDLDLVHKTGTFLKLDSLVQSGALSETEIDQALERILVLKYKLGLFKGGDISVDNMLAVTNSAEHRAVAREAAQKTMVLLKNDNNTLPFNPSSIKRMAVIGPNAKGVHFGGYTAEPCIGIDVLQGVQDYAKGKFDVLYAEGCKIALETPSFWVDNCQTPNTPEDDRRLIAEAVKVAKQSDVVLLVLGESVAFAREAWGENHRGDRESLDLLGMQDELAKQIFALGKPVAVLMINGRPLSFNYVAQNAPAIIEGFYLGQEGGTAVADVIFGDVNPSGKLAVTFPKSVGELPCFYNRKPSRMRSYVYVENAPLFAFGHGLSYTTYQYGAPTVDKSSIKKGQNVTVAVTVTNTGNRAGDEVVQLYLRDDVSSAVRPIMELKGFAKVSLKAGESREVKFVLTPDLLSFYNPQLAKVLEPGTFTVMTGPSSQKVQKTSFEVIQ
jgi:beta-glucosidase